jgi:ligand-binding sensor domain-containing protein
VEVLAPAPGGGVWAGTPNGLNLVHAGPDPIEQIYPDRKDPDRLSSGEVISLLTDRQGRLWVGTLDGGVHIMTGRVNGKPVFHRLGKVDGLPNDDINGLALDRAGQVWMMGWRRLTPPRWRFSRSGVPRVWRSAPTGPIPAPRATVAKSCSAALAG